MTVAKLLVLGEICLGTAFLVQAERRDNARLDEDCMSVREDLNIYNRYRLARCSSSIAKTELRFASSQRELKDLIDV